ncbi:type III secretion system cytoplasmic ring protein SctQ [Phyllobacterium salinisoli]|uniref:type III secretion system cytoplasmic ring protein SctQ n=1 Tax=Phyllobacterium salinisoli TaxID=1899321 RepID=UPI00135CCD0C|nr:type III secretion system cytoplasmic ring protein SctQ [Phyllobacterium salinisoli]
MASNSSKVMEADRWLPRLPMGCLESLNALYCPRLPLSLPHEGLTVEIHIARPWASITRPFVELPLTIGSWEGKLALPLAIAERVLEPVTGGKAASGLSPVSLALLMEHALADVLEKLEDDIGQPVHLDGAGKPETPLIKTPWQVVSSNVAAIAELHLPIGALEIMAAYLPSVAPPAQNTIGDDIPVPLQIMAGRQSLSYAELTSLRPGDIVLIDEAREDQAEALLANRYAARALRGPDGFRAAGSWHKSNHNQGTIMEAKSRPSGKPQAKDIDLDDLPVELVFEIGRRELTLGEIRQLAEGSVLLTAPGVDSAVDILANGRRIGKGDLVKIGEGLGVRVVRIAENG